MQQSKSSFFQEAQYLRVHLLRTCSRVYSSALVLKKDKQNIEWNTHFSKHGWGKDNAITRVGWLFIVSEKLLLMRNVNVQPLRMVTIV